jgi:hypothetical protein
MPGTTPLYNVKLQSSLNLNSQGLTGTNSAKRFVVKDVGATGKTIDVSDMSRLLKFSGARTITLNNNISGVTAGDTFTASSDSNLSYAGSATKIDSLIGSPVDDSIIQFIYTGSNTWVILNAN